MSGCLGEPSSLVLGQTSGPMYEHIIGFARPWALDISAYHLPSRGLLVFSFLVSQFQHAVYESDDEITVFFELVVFHPTVVEVRVKRCRDFEFRE